MSTSKFTSFIDNFHSYTKVNMTCIKNEHLLLMYPKNNHLLPLINYLYYKNPINESIGFSYDFNNIFFGVIKIESKNATLELLIGPIIKNNFNLSEAENIVSKLNLSSKEASKLIDELLLLKPMQYQEFINMLIFLNVSINNVQTSEKDLIKNFSEDKIKNIKSLKLPINQSNNTYIDKLKIFIKQGDHLGFSLFSNSYVYEDFDYSSLKNDDLRSYKNTIIFYMSRISGYAIEAGCDYKTINRITTLMSEKLEKAIDFKQSETIFQLAFKKYFDRVNSLKVTGDYHNIVKMAMLYINENVESNLQVNEIAKKLDISRSYLSKCFADDMGDTIQNYIMNTKLNHGVNLLVNTNISIVEISEKLKFSSQSHFQNTFKKHFKMTPLQYRRKYQNIII